MATVLEFFIPKDVLRRVTIGPRDPEMGITWSSRAVVDGIFRSAGGNIEQVITGPNWTFEQVRETLRGQHHINHGGISDIACWFQVFGKSAKEIGLSDKLTLAEIKASFENGFSVPMVPAYWLSFEECLARAGEENFRKAHGYGKTDLLEMPMAEAQKVARTKKSREFKVPHPNWTYLARRWAGDRYEFLEIYRVSWIPGARLQDCFIAGARRSVFDPTKWAVFVIGSRGGSTVAANAVLDRLPLVTGEVGLEKEAILRFTEGVEAYHDLLLARIIAITELAQRQGKGIEGFIWFGETELEKVGEQLGWPVKVMVPKWELKGIDFHALIEGMWYSGEELFPEKKYITIPLRTRESATT